ncbi:MAG: twin-arginine translocase TatA/TatE family subunit [Gemmatimonadaceae bacterium]|nr:twin-arginine translocase TatA/TatE family subunit [Gemmatimonadaceae bacterium]
MPFGLGMGEMLIGLVIVLLLFGAKRIPEIAGSLGKGINQFKKNINDVDKTIRESDTQYRAEVRAAEPPPRVDDPTAEPKRLM